MCVRHQVSLPYSITARPLSSPTRPESSILVDSHPFTTENYTCYGTGKKFTNRGQCTSLAPNIPQRLLTLDILPESLMRSYSKYLISIWMKMHQKKRCRGVEIPGARLSTMAKRCFWITASAESATCLSSQNTCRGYPGCLATLPSHS